MNEPRKLISIVTPCYNEQDNVRDCHQAVRRLFEGDLAAYEREHIFCDNASTDRTPAVLAEMAAEDPCVRVIFNARNFGPFRSTYNGITSASGDAVMLLLAADMQDPPELLTDFVRLWEQGYEVVYGIRKVREEGWLMRTIRRMYYRTVSTLADIEIPLNVGEFQLVDRKVVDVLRACDDYYPYIRGLVANCGFRRAPVEYNWKARRKGFSKNRLYHLVDQGLNGLVSFTNVPMRLCLLGGVSLSALSIGYAGFSLLYHLLVQGAAPAGTATLITGLFFFSGVQLFFLGTLGEYISAIHSQVRKRPLVIERGRLNFPTSGGAVSRAA
jgi:glycosyltransferase involved in cell wall biosynthesis